MWNDGLAALALDDALPPVATRHICCMGGGGEPATQTQQTNSSTAPPNETKWMHNELAGQIYGDFQNHPQAPEYFNKSTVANFSPETENALTTMYSRGAAGQSSAPLQPGFGYINDTLGGKYLDLNSNPYFQGALEAGFRPQTKQFMTDVLPGVTAQFSGAGRYGSGQQNAYTGLALDSLNTAQADAAARASAATYGDERNRQSQVASWLPQFASTKADLDYKDIEAMLGAGMTRDQQAQRGIDAEKARWDYDQTKDVNWKAYIGQLLGQTFPGSTTTGVQAGQAKPASNSGAQTAGMVTSGVGMALSAAAIIM